MFCFSFKKELDENQKAILDANLQEVISRLEEFLILKIILYRRKKEVDTVLLLRDLKK